jgi:hypothetical protein
MYTVYDTHNREVVATCKTRRAARARADKLDNIYGAVRYTVRYI